MKIATEYANTNTPSYLSQSKLFLLLDVPLDQREEFIESNNIESLTTRQLQDEIKKYYIDQLIDIIKIFK